MCGKVIPGTCKEHLKYSLYDMQDCMERITYIVMSEPICKCLFEYYIENVRFILDGKCMDERLHYCWCGHGMIGASMDNVWLGLIWTMHDWGWYGWCMIWANMDNVWFGLVWIMYDLG